MATAETLSALPLPQSPFQTPSRRTTASGGKPLIQARNAAPGSEKVTFDSSKHLQYTPPLKVYSMKELGFSESKGVSPIGVSEPFPLFSAEAVDQIRAEVLSDAVWEKHQYSSDLAQCQLRGYAPE